jgi:hypothetical protein
MLGVAANRPAQILLAGGCLGAAALAVDSLVEVPLGGAPYVIAVFGLFVFAFVVVTRRSVPLPAAAVATGGICGLGAALLPALVFMVRPPIPRSGEWALVLVGVAMVAAAVGTAWRGGFRFVNAVLSGLLAAVVATLLLGPIMAAMLRFGPDRWVPRMESHALTPAARLAERRSLAGEPYLFVLLLGAALALILGVLALRTRRRARTAQPLRHVGRPGHIELGEV